jgi:hypothetical protein
VSDHVDVVPAITIGSVQHNYKRLTKAPNEILHRLNSYPSKFADFHVQWTAKNSSLSLNGQRAIEVACFADVTCHAFEYPLRVATLDYIEENLIKSDVLNTVQWISRAYKSGLPLDAPNEDSGEMRGLLLEAMNTRMVDYAEELLNPRVPSLAIQFFMPPTPSRR